MRALGGVLAVVVAMSTLTGCGNSGDGATPPATSSSPLAPSAPPSPTPSDPAALAEQRALAAYDAMWATYDQAGRAPEANPDDERLASYAGGRALELLSEGLRSMLDQGLVIEGEVVLNPEVVELSPAATPTEARIEDCGDSSNWLSVDVETGEVTDDPRGRQLVIATVRDMGDGQWKVLDFAIREVGSCG
jgi:hypothetical protein